MLHLTVHYSVIMGFYWSNFTILYSYASVYLLEQGFRNTDIGLMTALAALLSAVFQPILGAYADRPRSPSVKVLFLILTGLFLGVTAVIPLAVGKSPLILITAYGAALMLMQTMTPLSNALGTLSVGAGHYVNFGIARGIGSLSCAVISLIMGRISSTHGVSFIPVTAIIAYLILVLCVLPFPFRKNAVTAPREKGGSFLRKYPSFVILLVSACCLYSSHILLTNYTFQIVSFKGGDSESLGIAVAIAALSELPIMFGFTRLLKRMSAEKWLVLSGFAFLAKCVATLLVPDVLSYYFVQTLQLLGYAVITVASVYYIAGIMEPQDAVKGQAFFTMTNTAGAVLASALGGWMLDAHGVTALLVTATVFAGAGAVIMCLGIRRRSSSGA